MGNINIESHTIEWLVNPNLRGDHAEMYLPFYQRAYVWEKEKVEWLFDSLLKDYFFGSFLLLYTHDSSDSLYNLLSFKEADKTIGDPVDTTRISGRHYYSLIDGQQRVTSFKIGLNKNGYYEPKKYVTRRLFRLYMWLGEDNYIEENTNDNIVNDEIGADNYSYFKMLLNDSAPYTNNREKWFLVSDLSDIRESVLEKKELGHETTDEQLMIDVIKGFVVSHNLSDTDTTIQRICKLYCKVYIENVASCVILKDSSDSDVLETFVRLNVEGTPLSYPDLSISKISSWFEQNDHTPNRSKDVKVLINNIIESITKFTNNPAANFNVNSQYILKTIIVLNEYKNRDSSNEEVDIRFRSLQKLTNDKIKMMSKEWDNYASCIQQTFQLISSDKINMNGYFINTYNSLIPISLYLYNQKNFNRNTWQSVSDATLKAIQWYLLWVSLNKTFNSHTDEVIKAFCDALRKADYDFKGLIQHIKTDQGITNKNIHQKISSLTENLTYPKNRQAILAVLFILYPDVAKDSRNKPIAIEHLHPKTPKAECKSQLEEVDKKNKNTDSYANCKNKLPNLSLVYQVGAGRNSSNNNSTLDEKIANQHLHGNEEWSDEYLLCNPGTSKDITKCHEFWKDRSCNIFKKLCDYFKDV